MFEQNIWRCGAVDVNDGSGLARRGMIRDLFPSKGLIIDFGYLHHHAQLIPFSQCSIHPRKDPFKAGDAVETLFRCSPNGPWCWYPSKVLAGSWDTYAFVEVLIDGKAIRQVVSVEKVRRHSSVRGDEEYYGHNLDLSNTPWAEEKINNERFLEMWNQATGTVCARIQQGKLEYISMRAEPLSDAECCKQVSDLWFRSSGRGIKRTAAGEVVLINAIQGISTAESAVPGSISAELACINKHLPKEILRNIFCRLDVDMQVKCSEVCRYWNSVVHSTTTSIHVEIDLAQCGSQKLATMLHRMITPSTRVLVLTCRFRPETGCNFPIHIVMEMLQALDIKIPMIMFTRMHVWADDLLDYTGPVIRIRSEWQQVCQQLALHKITVCGLLEADSAKYKEFKLQHGDRDFRIRRPAAQLGLIVDVETGIADVRGATGTENLMGVLEQSIVDSETMDGMLNSMLQSPLRRQTTVALVRLWQINDDRFHPDLHWSAINLGAVKLQSLRPVTKRAMILTVLRMIVARRQRQAAMPAQPNNLNQVHV